MAKKVDREKLGKIGDKEYFMNMETGEIEWRIPNVRESIEPESDDFCILSADFSQIEVKIMAFMSGDTWLMEAINSGKDIHCYMAHDIYGEARNFTYEDIKAAKDNDNHPRHDELVFLRNGVKSVVFGTVYGAAAKKIAFLTGMKVEEAQDIIDRFFTKAYKLKTWLEDQGRNAFKFGFSTSIEGRKRFFPLPSFDDPQREEIMSQIKRWAGNAPIQGTSADMMKLAKVFIYEELKRLKISWADARILFSLHDEIVMQARKSIGEQVRKIMQDSMNKAYDVMIQGIINNVKVSLDDHWVK